MNRQLAELLHNDEKLYPHRLAAEHPHIIDRIVALWGSAGLEDYFRNLMLDSRGTRTGFDPAVLAEIFALHNHYIAQRPAPARNANTWGELTEIGQVRLERSID